MDCKSSLPFIFSSLYNSHHPLPTKSLYPWPGSKYSWTLHKIQCKYQSKRHLYAICQYCGEISHDQQGIWPVTLTYWLCLWLAVVLAVFVEYLWLAENMEKLKIEIYGGFFKQWNQMFREISLLYAIVLCNSKCI